jgi:hypothetical protein
VAKRYNTRAIKKHRNYTADELAELLNAHPQTIRGWVDKGLPCLKSSTPHLFIGAHVQAFLTAQSIRKKKPLAPDELYCLCCKTGKTPAGLMADFIPDGAGGGRLIGLCPDCESVCNRFTREEKIPLVAPNLAVQRQAKETSLEEPGEAA